jgi:DNA-binding XRE family transcriptional regulator
MTKRAPLKAPPVPCGSCPYRRDVPSGIWARYEYDKLPPYDRKTMHQPLAVFMCHQRNGTICGGWLACHLQQDGGHDLLALRFSRNIDPSVFSYQTDVPVFSSGAEAREHGLRDYKRPGAKAHRMINGLKRKQMRGPLPAKLESATRPDSEPEGTNQAMTIVPARPASQLVKRARKKLKMTQEQFARQLGLSRYTIMRFEAGDPVPEPTRMAIRYLLGETAQSA